MLYDYEAEGNNGFDPVDFDVLMDDLAHVDAEASDSEDADCTTDEEGSEENDYQSRKKKRKTCSDVVVFRRKKYKVPRVLVNDIRKCYAKMFMNVMNSGDFALLYGFLDTYYAGNAQHVVTKYMKGDPNHCFKMSFFGVEEIAKYWYGVQNLCPDSAVHMSDTAIQHTSGTVFSKLQVSGTRLYEEPNTHVSYFTPHVLLDDIYDSEDMCVCNEARRDVVVGNSKGGDDMAMLAVRHRIPMEVKLESIRRIERSMEGFVRTLPLRSKQECVVADANFPMYTDEFKRISKLEMIIMY